MLAGEIIFLCLAFWGLCWLGTGTDAKNSKRLSAYPDEIQKTVKKDPILGLKVKTTSPVMAFCANVLVFLVVLFPFGFFLKEQGFYRNFRNVLILGQVLNLFDFLVIDLLWWRHSKRVRFTGTKNKPEKYRDPKNHAISFCKGILAFLLVAGIDGYILSLISDLH